MSTKKRNAKIITEMDVMQSFVGMIPTFEEALNFLRTRYGNGLSEELVRDWFNFMECSCWCDKEGKPCRNWPRVFFWWQRNYKFYHELYNPDRLYDARKNNDNTITL